MTQAFASRSCIAGLVLVAFLCFLIGFTCQLAFHLLPSEHEVSSNLRSDFQQKELLGADVVEPTAPFLVAVEPVEHKQTVYNTEEIPNIVKAWRNAKLDWHSLLPKHNSEWERFGTPKSEGKLRLLVSKETLVTDYLTRFKESGLASQYGHDHGPLLDYTGCNAFVSPCMIHNEAACHNDQLCTWSTDTALCVGSTSEGGDSGGNGHENQCSSPKLMGDHGWEPVVSPSTQCKVWSSQPAVLLSVDSESQTMFYHWWASWSSITEYWTGALQSARDVTFFIRDVTDPMFFQYFGMISDKCWRRTGGESNRGLCFCDTKQFNALQSRHHPQRAADLMMGFLGLDEVQPPADRVRVGLISRRRKRFILNEYELVERVRALGYDCELLPLESMTLYEQMRALRALDVLIGIHGSALDNSVFLHRGSVMLQLLPYKVEHRVTFRQSAESAGMRYMEWQLKDASKAFFHWDLMEQANSEKMRRMGREAILRAGQVASDNRETTMFWINQDIIVPLEEWTPLVIKAVKSSPAAKRGARIAPLDI